MQRYEGQERVVGVYASDFSFQPTRWPRRAQRRRAELRALAVDFRLRPEPRCLRRGGPLPSMLGCETSGLVLVQKAGYGVCCPELGVVSQLGTLHEL
jgi:hypothetical protein